MRTSESRRYWWYSSTSLTERSCASSGFWPNSLRARRWRSRSQHWSSACSAAASRACSSAPEISPDASLVRSSCSVWMRSSMWPRISLSFIGSTVSPARPSSAVPGVSLAGLVAGPQQGIGDGFLQRVPGRGDDVLVHAYRAPGAVRRAGAVPGLDEHPGHRAGAVRVLQDADLVVRQLQHGQLGVEPLQRQPQGVVQGVDGAVALAGGDDPLALRGQLDRGLADHRPLGAALDDHPPRLHLEVPPTLYGHFVAQQELIAR